MPKKIDITPISVERTRKTLRYELIINSDGQLVEVLAHRWLFTVKTDVGGGETSSPEYLGEISISAEDVPQAFKNRISDLEAISDSVD